MTIPPQVQTIILYLILLTNIFSTSQTIAANKSCIELYSKQKTSLQNPKVPIEDALFKSTKEFTSLKSTKMSVLCSKMLSFNGICLRLVVEKLLPESKKNPIMWNLPESNAPFVDINRLYPQGSASAIDNFYSFSGKVKARNHHAGSNKKLLQLSIESESQFIDALELLLEPSQLITKIRRAEIDGEFEQLLFGHLDKVNFLISFAFSSEWIVFIPKNLDKRSMDLYSQLRTATKTNRENLISILSTATENSKTPLKQYNDNVYERQRVVESYNDWTDQRSSPVDIIATIANSGQNGVTHYTNRQSLPSILLRAALLPSTHLTNDDIGLSKKNYGFDGKIYVNLTPESLTPRALPASQFSSGSIKMLNSENDSSTRFSVEALNRVYLYFDLQMLRYTPKYHIARDGMSQYGNYVPEVDFLYDPVQNIGSSSRLKTFLDQGPPGEVVFHTSTSSANTGISLENLKGIWVAEPMHQAIVAELKANGIESFNRIPIEQFIIPIPIKEKLIEIRAGKLIFEK